MLPSLLGGTGDPTENEFSNRRGVIPTKFFCMALPYKNNGTRKQKNFQLSENSVQIFEDLILYGISIIFFHFHVKNFFNNPVYIGWWKGERLGRPPKTFK